MAAFRYVDASPTWAMDSEDDEVVCEVDEEEEGEGEGVTPVVLNQRRPPVVAAVLPGPIPRPNPGHGPDQRVGAAAGAVAMIPPLLNQRPRAAYFFPGNVPRLASPGSTPGVTPRRPGTDASERFEEMVRFALCTNNLLTL